MKLDITQNTAPVIDIVIAVAERGGVENCINMLGRFLTGKGYRVRIFQEVFEGTGWADGCMEFHYAFSSRKGHDLEEFVKGYSKFVEEQGAPSLAIAAAWPMMTYVAAKVSSVNESGFLVASWLHATLKRYEASGFGGAEYVKYADMHFCISDEIASEIRSADGEAVIYRVNNPVEGSKIRPVEDLKPGVLLFVGRLSEEKNIGAILKAMAAARSEWKLRLVGDGEERAEIERQAQELGLSSRVEFMGWSDDPWKYAQGAYALIMSSVYEGSPLAAIEALSCGLPVIANVSSRVTGIVKPGVNGYLYPDNATEELAKILDFIADGKLPEITPASCRESVLEYSGPVALWDVYCKIHAAVNGRMIQDKLYGKSEEPVICDKVSVIIPCYNVEKYLRRCLDSVLSQTIGIHHLEIIAVNDCSTDCTAEILREYEARFPENICIIECEENCGQSHARNTALEYVTGNYVTFVDSDDCIAENMLEILVLADKCYPSDFVSCGFKEFDDEPDLSRLDAGSARFMLMESDQDLKQFFISNAFITAPWGKLFKTEFLRMHRAVRFPEGYRMEDIFFTYMSVAYAGSWQYVPSGMYCYFRNPEGIMRSGRIREYYMDVHKVFAMAMEAYRNAGVYDRLKPEVEFIYYKKVYRDIAGYIESIGGAEEGNKDILKGYIREHFPAIMDNPYLGEEDRKFLTSEGF